MIIRIMYDDHLLAYTPVINFIVSTSPYYSPNTLYYRSRRRQIQQWNKRSFSFALTGIFQTENKRVSQNIHFLV